MAVGKWENHLHMKVSINGGTPKSSILIGVSLINNPFGDPPWLWKHPHGEMSTAMFDSQKNQARNPRDRRHWKCTGSSIDRKGGWNTESWGYPQNGCLIREHPDRKWMMTGGYPPWRNGNLPVTNSHGLRWSFYPKPARFCGTFAAPWSKMTWKKTTKNSLLGGSSHES